MDIGIKPFNDVENSKDQSWNSPDDSNFSQKLLSQKCLYTKNFPSRGRVSPCVRSDCARRRTG